MKLFSAIEAYIERKRAQGFDYKMTGSCLLALGKSVGNLDLECVTAQEVLAFLDRSKSSPRTWEQKYLVLRAFFDYWLARGEIEVLPMPLRRKAGRHSFVRHVYTHAELRALFKTVPPNQDNLACSIAPRTLRTVLIFLYGTGAMVGEALQMLVEDVDLDKGMITIRGKFFKQPRTIPICPNLQQEMKKYFETRRRQGTHAPHFFVTRDGEALRAGRLIYSFLKRCNEVGLIHSHATFKPRMYDLRHTFAVHRIAGWIKHGANLNRMLPALAVYMGLTGLRATEPYLCMTPERFRTQLVKLSPSPRGKRRWRDDPELMQFLAHLSEDNSRSRSVDEATRRPPTY